MGTSQPLQGIPCPYLSAFAWAASNGRTKRLLLKATPSWLFVLEHMYWCCLDTSAPVHDDISGEKTAKWQPEKMDPSASQYSCFQEQSSLSLFFVPCFEQVALFWKHHFSICLSFSLFPNAKRHCQRVDCETEAKIWQIELNSVISVVCFVFPCRWIETWLQIRLYLEEKEEGKNTAEYVDGCKRSGPPRLNCPFLIRVNSDVNSQQEKKIQL